MNWRNKIKKLFQSEWHGIKFEDISNISRDRLADSDFYDNYYKEFFIKFSDWNELDSEWLNLKKDVAEFLINDIELKKENSILAIGCGIGIIEKYLLEYGFDNVELTEVSESPVKWISKLIKPSKIFLGRFPDCLPEHKLYDLIYIASVEYVFNDEDLIAFMKNIKKRLMPAGKIVLFSWSFEKNKKFPDNVINAVINILKKIKNFRFAENEQLWGFIRKIDEIEIILLKAGFNNYRDGIFKRNTKWETFWIQGIND